MIAQEPAPERDHSRLLVVDRGSEAFSDIHFFDLPKVLRPGDLLVVNNTRVIPARLFGRKQSGGRVEILALGKPDSAEENPAIRSCLVKSSKRPKEGSLLFFDSGLVGEVQEVLEGGLVEIRFRGGRPLEHFLEEKGHMPLPPYIKREEGNGKAGLDRERYQTIFSEFSGAVAAPTAGLHFTRGLLGKLRAAGIALTALTLHVGYGTFRPVRARDIRKHNLGEEFYRIEPETVEAIRRTKEAGGRLIAVGTTVVRALETAARADGSIRAGEGKTELLITPGFSFRVVDGLVTNFHLPKSSLLFLVCAFAGQDLVKRAYRVAVEKGYRFFSYGDAMAIL